MRVKFAKAREANLIKLTDDITQNVLDWRAFLLSQGFKPNEPLFPRITSHFSQGDMLKTEITHELLKSGSSISAVFKKAFTSAGFEYLRVHSFRHTLARAAGKRSPQYLNAMSKSLGHSNIDTTIQSYGDISPYERREVLAEPLL
jgi:integrase